MLEFVFWDVQHGNACYINTPNGRHMVVDPGTGSYGDNKPFSPLLHLKGNYGVKQLDYVIITHPHRDHLDDIFNFDALSPITLHRPNHLTDAQILEGNKKEDSAKINEYLKISHRYNTPVQPGSGSDFKATDQWGGVEISVFFSSGCNTGNLNNHSAVTIFNYAGSKIIVPGDNESESWKELIKRTDFVAAAKSPDVLLAPHHGRSEGYCPELFEAIGKPYITIISDGPYSDTSATSSYGNQSKSWRVYYPDDTYEERKCVTTRKDGVVRVRAYFASEDGKRRLNVFVQKGSAAKVPHTPTVPLPR
jgi:beta-lactamase superfamily II metal-dependent hydrolase